MAKDEESVAVVEQEFDPHAPKESADSGGDKGTGDKTEKNGKGDDLRELRRELAAARRLAEEHAENAKYWAEQAKRGAVQEEPEPETDDDEPHLDAETAESFVDELSRDGFPAILKRLAKAGIFLTKKEAKALSADIAEETTDRKIGAAVMANQITTDYPELKNRNSELYKSLDKQIIDERKATGNPKWSPSDREFKSMVKATALELKMNGNGKRGRDGDDDGYDSRRSYESEDNEFDRETERRQRIDRQDGPRGRRGGEFHEEHESRDTLAVWEAMGVKPETARKYKTTGRRD